jgi:hypothetical protein
MIASLYSDSDAIKVIHLIAFGKKVEAAIARQARDSRKSGDAWATAREACSPMPRGLGEIDFEAVAFALVAAGHLGAGVAEMLLPMGFFDLGRGGEAANARRTRACVRPSDRLRVERRLRQARAAQPGGEAPPIGGVGAPRA